MLYFIEKFNGVFVTQMNKLLFYADFLAYRSRGLGLTGLVLRQYLTDQSQSDGTGYIVSWMI